MVEHLLEQLVEDAFRRRPAINEMLTDIIWTESQFLHLGVGLMLFCHTEQILQTRSKLAPHRDRSWDLWLIDLPESSHKPHPAPSRKYQALNPVLQLQLCAASAEQEQAIVKHC